jgi:hypothetical protein
MADVTTTFAAKDESFAKTVENLQGRLKGFEGGVQGFTGKVGEMAAGFGKLLGPLAAAGAAFLGIKSAAEAFFGAIRVGGELNDLSARTGESAGNLAILQRAFENAGSSAGAVGPMINRLQRFIVEAGDSASAQAQALGGLGISLEDLKTKSPLEQMQTLASAISNVEDPAQRTALAMQIFGRSGGELMPLLRAMGVELDTARAQLGAWPAALDKSNQALDAIGDNFTAIKNKGIEFATGLLVNVAPGLAEVTKKIAEIDAARLGMILSEHLANFLKAADGALNFSKNLDAVKIAIQGMASGQISEGLSLLFVTAKIQALSLVNEFVKSFTAGLQTIGGFFANMFDSKGALFHLMSTLFGAMGNIMQEKLFSAMAGILEQFGPWGAKMAAALTMHAETAANSYKMAMFGIGAQVDLVGEQMFNAGAAMPKAFAENRSKLDPLFDITDEIAEQTRLQENIKANLAASAQEAGKTADNVGRANENATGFKDKVTAATDDLNFSADLYTGPGGVAAATKDAAAKTSSASRDTMDAFNTAKGAGEKLETNLKNAAINFGREVLESGRLFKQDITAAMGQLTSFTKGLATESTLQRAANALERLERKLPQPVLT